MVVGLVAHGYFLSPSFLESLGVYVLTHRCGVADGTGVGEGGHGHSSRDKSVSNRVESEDTIAVRIIETFAVCVKLRTHFLEALSTFSTVITIVIRNTFCMTSFLIFRKKDRWLFHRRAGVSTVNLSVFTLVWDG